MIDFTPTENDQAVFDQARAAALICRRYARHYDEHEEEMAPETLPEAEEFYASQPTLPPAGPEDTSLPTRMARLGMINYWGDYTVRLRREGDRLPAEDQTRGLRGRGDLGTQVLEDLLVQLGGGDG